MKKGGVAHDVRVEPFGNTMASHGSPSGYGDCAPKLISYQAPRKPPSLTPQGPGFLRAKMQSISFTKKSSNW